ncbi:MAG TPA: hypothetical protein VFQ72_02265 [Candidatus Paceibacterota bacterium]|nr:hypothetical protein [Candidatus Paceibacterota bacterium]
MFKFTKHIKVTREQHSFLKIDALCEKVSINQLVYSIFERYMRERRAVLVDNVKKETGDSQSEATKPPIADN